MNQQHTPSLAIRRNNDGTYSVIDTRFGIRLVKAGSNHMPKQTSGAITGTCVMEGMTQDVASLMHSLRMLPSVIAGPSGCLGITR
jgi:hypothetical protein